VPSSPTSDRGDALVLSRHGKVVPLHGRCLPPCSTCALIPRNARPLIRLRCCWPHMATETPTARSDGHRPRGLTAWPACGRPMAGPACSRVLVCSRRWPTQPGPSVADRRELAGLLSGRSRPLGQGTCRGVGRGPFLVRSLEKGGGVSKVLDWHGLPARTAAFLDGEVRIRPPVCLSWWRAQWLTASRPRRRAVRFGASLSGARRRCQLFFRASRRTRRVRGLVSGSLARTLQV